MQQRCGAWLYTGAVDGSLAAVPGRVIAFQRQHGLKTTVRRAN